MQIFFTSSYLSVFSWFILFYKKKCVSSNGEARQSLSSMHLPLHECGSHGDSMLQQASLRSSACCMRCAESRDAAQHQDDVKSFSESIMVLWRQQFQSCTTRQAESLQDLHIVDAALKAIGTHSQLAKVRLSLATLWKGNGAIPCIQIGAISLIMQMNSRPCQVLSRPIVATPRSTFIAGGPTFGMCLKF